MPQWQRHTVQRSDVDDHLSSHHFVVMFRAESKQDRRSGAVAAEREGKSCELDFVNVIRLLLC